MFLPFRSQQRWGGKKIEGKQWTLVAGMLTLGHLFGVSIYTVHLKLLWSLLLHQNQKVSHMVIRKCRGMWFWWKKLQRSKGSCTLRLITGTCEDFCPPFPVASLASAFLLSSARSLQSWGDTSHAAARRANMSPFQPSLYRDSTSPSILYTGMAQQQGERASLPMTIRAALPHDRNSFLQEKWAVPSTNSPKAFFSPFQLTAMYHCKFYTHHLDKHTEEKKALRTVAHGKMKNIPLKHNFLW